MAILGKIRERSIFLIFIIGMALLAFVFTGLFDGNSNTSQDPVIVVGDEEVGIDEFSRQVDFAERSYRMSTMQAVNFAYEQSTNAKAFEQTFDVLGLAVGKSHIEQFLKADPNFSSDPQFQDENGIFDPELFAEFILGLSQNNPQGFEQWKAQEATIINNLRVQHYQDMVAAGMHTTTFEAQQDYAYQNDNIDLKYVRIPYSIIPDSLVSVSSKDIEKYLKENKTEYKREASRNLRYVQFSEDPTPDDKVLIENELRVLLTERTLFNEVSKQEETLPSLASVSIQNLPSFVGEHSDLPYQDRFVTENEISSNYANTLFTLDVGEVFGPYEDNGFTNISRLVAREKGGKAKARHILIAFSGATRVAEDITRTKAQAKTLANSLLRKVKRGADFAELARENSDGPSAPRGGELPEFVQGDMVAPFGDFVFKNRVGALGVVETEFGYHVIEVQDKKDVVKLATIAKKLLPSEATSNQVFTAATQFELAVQQNDFTQQVKLNSYTIKELNGVKALDETLASLGAQRQVIRWAFEAERKPLDIKRFSLSSGGYIVVQVSDILTEGLPSADEVQADVVVNVRNEKKKALLLEQINPYSSLEEVAQQFELTVNSSKAVNRKTSMLVGVSQETEVVGASFGLEKNVVSDPIAGNSGVFVVQVTENTPAASLTNYAGFKASLTNSTKQNLQANIAAAIKGNFNVEDNRNVYY